MLAPNCEDENLSINSSMLLIKSGMCALLIINMCIVLADPFESDSVVNANSYVQKSHRKPTGYYIQLSGYFMLTVRKIIYSHAFLEQRGVA